MYFCPSICPSVCHAPYLRNRTSSNHNFWYNCVKWWYLQVFFHFFRNFIFWDYRGVKGQKITQNEKWQWHLSRAIPQEQYSPWSLFLVQLCKMMVSPGDFLIFVKFSIFIPRISGPVPHMNVVFGTCVKWWYFQQFFFFHFFKILIFLVFRNSSINAKMKLWGVPHLLHMCVIFPTFYFL